MTVIIVFAAVISPAILFMLLCLRGFHRAEREYLGVTLRYELRSEVNERTLPTQDKVLRIPLHAKPSIPAGQKRRGMVMVVLVLLIPAARVQAEDREQTSALAQSPDNASTTEQPQAAPPTKSTWQYGTFLDAAYLWDPDHPVNQLFRSRGTAYQVNKPMVNMAGVYVRKSPSESSRWGSELTVQVGQDTRIFGFSATAPNLPGSKWLRHLGPTNFSYLAPVGKGLTVQGGIFNSLIGYDSLYAKDNLNYTRPWGADFTPYLMMGINASYPFSSKVSGTVFVVNGYWHLANANNVPSSGGQLAYKPTDRMTLKQTFIYGPHQSDTALEFWRFLSDSTAEWKSDKTTIAFEYQVGTENLAGTVDARALWMAAQLPIRRGLSKRWSIALRPEVYWDRDGRMTTFAQTVKAVTTTLEYRIPFWQTNTKLRLEHRIDDSRGPAGGFFKNGEVSAGVPRLTPTQNLLIFGVLWSLDASSETKWK